MYCMFEWVSLFQPFHVIFRNEQSILVQDLEPNTKYEFAIRLHLDQLSSPWSPVVYQSTLPEGDKYILQTEMIIISTRFKILCRDNIVCHKLLGWKDLFSRVFWSCALYASHLPAPTVPPSHVKVTLIEVDTALVSWKPPDEPNVAVTHYTVLYASRHAWIAGEWQVLQREGEECKKRWFRCDVLSHTNGPLEISNSFHPLIHVSVHGDLWMAPGHGGARCFCLADKRSVWRLNVITTKGLNLPLYTVILWGTFLKNRSYLSFVLIPVKLQRWSMILFTSSVCLLSIETWNVDLNKCTFSVLLQEM